MASIQIAEVAAATAPTPAAGSVTLYEDTADSALKAKNSSGNSRTTDNTVYRPLLALSGRMANDATNATYAFSQGGAMIASGGNHASPLWVPTTYIDDAYFGTGAKLLVVGQIYCSATAPGTITFTFGLHNISAVAGGTDIMTYTMDAAVSGSTSTVVNPLTSTRNLATTAADFAVPADGHYTLGLATSAALANNLAVSASAQLYVRNT